MAQLIILGISALLIVLGIKGFTATGIPLTKTTSLKGTTGRIVGVLCIAFGVLFIPLYVLFIVGYGRLLER